MITNNQKGLLFALSASFLVSFFPLAFRELGRLHEPLLCILALFLVSFAFSSIPMVLKPSRFRLNKKAYIFVVIVGAISVVGNWSYMQALQMLEPAIASVIQRVELVFVAILGALFLAEKISVHLVVAIVFSLVGLFFLQGGEFAIDDFRLEAIGITLLSALSFAIMLLFTKFAMRHTGVLTINFYRLLLISIVLSISLNVFQKLPELTLIAWGLAMISAICGPVVARFLITISLKHITMAKALLCTMLSPLLTALWQWLFYDLTLNSTELAGGGLILFGILFVILRGDKNKTPEAIKEPPAESSM